MKETQSEVQEKNLFEKRLNTTANVFQEVSGS